MVFQYFTLKSRLSTIYSSKTLVYLQLYGDQEIIEHMQVLTIVLLLLYIYKCKVFENAFSMELQ